MEEVFEKILEKDEKLVKVFKPNKKKFWRCATWMFWVPIFWPHMLAVLICSFFTAPLFVKKTYEKRFYAYTNKRLLIRCGTIGIDYESLRYKDVTSVDVSVGFLDRGLNTGSIVFGSPSRPNIKNVQGGAGNPFSFRHIENPYEIMKEVNEYIEIAKQ